MKERGVTTHLFWCWNSGLQPRYAIESVQRECGVTLTFEEVRRAYARISHNFAAPAEPVPNSPHPAAGAAPVPSFA